MGKVISYGKLPVGFLDNGKRAVANDFQVGSFGNENGSVNANLTRNIKS